jgi:23S rRNA (uracil1939-C5)-methyltransferase
MLEEKIKEIIGSERSFNAESLCPHFSICNGCALQNLPSAEQIKKKQLELADLFKSHSQLVPNLWLPPLTGPIWHYRHKARLGVRYVKKKDTVLVGFREKQNSRFLAEIETCKILPKKMSDLILPLRNLIQSLSIYNKIAQIEVAVGGQDQIALIFRHLAPLNMQDLKILTFFAEKYKVDCYLQPKGMSTVHKIWPENTPERLTYFVKKYGLSYDFHPCDFTQINPDINQKMITLALELLALSNNDVVLDLFCGLGNFSLPMALYAKQVIGLEGDKNMVMRAKENAIKNKVTNVDFFMQDLFRADLSEFILNLGKENVFTKVLLDPPRSGAEAILPVLSILGIHKIVYISCNPITLARDSAILVKKYGYRLVKAGIMDMFPHTQHIESIAVFEKDD